METGKMNVGLTGVCLGHKTSQEANNDDATGHNKTGVLKVEKEQPWKLVGHVTTAPSVINHADDWQAVFFPNIAEFHRYRLSEKLECVSHTICPDTVNFPHIRLMASAVVALLPDHRG